MYQRDPDFILYEERYSPDSPNPIWRIVEVNKAGFRDSKLIKSSFKQRVEDFFKFLIGQGYFPKKGEKPKEIYPGVLDFVIPSYYVNKLLAKWLSNFPNLSRFLFPVTLILGFAGFGLAIAKVIFAGVLFVLSLPAIGITHAVYHRKYKRLKASLKELSLQENEGEKTMEDIFQKISKRKYFLQKGNLTSYADIMSKVQTAELVSDEETGTLKIIISGHRHRDDEYTIAVSPGNKDALNAALHLNAFGITSQLAKQQYDDSKSALDVVLSTISSS